MEPGLFWIRYIWDYDYIDTNGSVVVGENIYPIGPICHLIGYQFDLPGGEDGKSVGLPTLYDPNLNSPGHSAGIGAWGLMGSGLWNNNGVTPAPPCAWSRAGHIRPTPGLLGSRRRLHCPARG